jgi:hypothetical protein
MHFGAFFLINQHANFFHEQVLLVLYAECQVNKKPLCKERLNNLI